MAAYTVDSEYGRLTDITLCRPTHFQWSDVLPETSKANAVVRETLRSGQKFDEATALDQYDQFVSALEGAGVTCHFTDTDPALSYQIYTRDSSVMTPWGVLITQLYRVQRRGEVAPIYRHYQRMGVPVWGWSTAGPIEGGDIHLIRPGLAVIGYTGNRTTEPAARQLQAWLEAEGWEARLEPFAEHFLHLDLLYATVNERLALVCKEVLSDDFVQWLSDRQIEAIPVSYKDAMLLRCNCLSLGDDRVLSSSSAKEVNANLRAAGITVLDPDLDMFTMAGGGPRCMSMPLNREPG